MTKDQAKFKLNIYEPLELNMFAINRLPYLSARDWIFIFSSLAILSGLTLSVISWLKLCTEQCAATHHYRIFGIQFETIGLLFFPVLTVFHFFSRKYDACRLIAGILLATALGAELMFIDVQKREIGHWCPVCLGIAGCVTAAAIGYGLNYLMNLKTTIKEGQKGEIMQRVLKGFGSLMFVFFGLFFAYFGVGKADQLKAQEDTIKERIVFGNLNSPVDVYIFTDWQCPACRGIEPTLVKIAPAIEKKARVTFVDFIIHPETLNFIPYNLSFMIHNKDKYLELRDALTKISTKTGDPTEQDVEKAIAHSGIKYDQLSYSDVAVGIKYFKHLGKEFKITSTPTVVIVNKSTKKGKKLHGGSEITESNILKAIDSLQ